MQPYPKRPDDHPPAHRSDQKGQPPGHALRQPRPEGAVGKITGKEGLRFTGKAIVFNSEEKALQAILDGKM